MKFRTFALFGLFVFIFLGLTLPANAEFWGCRGPSICKYAEDEDECKVLDKCMWVLIDDSGVIIGSEKKDVEPEVVEGETEPVNEVDADESEINVSEEQETEISDEKAVVEGSGEDKQAKIERAKALIEEGKAKVREGEELIKQGEAMLWSAGESPNKLTSFATSSVGPESLLYGIFFLFVLTMMTVLYFHRNQLRRMLGKK